MSDTESVVRYYDECQIDYEMVWHLKSHLSMHYGYWLPGTKNLRESLIEMNRQLVQAADIQEGDRVLDAGCGVGGSSIFLAQNYGCRVTGITLAERQVEHCRKNGESNGVGHLANFETADYLNTPFEDSTFDVVWAIESVCYADQKIDFLKEAYRVLKPGGRVVVADFFANRSIKDEQEKLLMNKWTDCWAITSYAQKDAFFVDMKNAGFVNRTKLDATANVLPSIKRLYYMFYPGIVTSKVGEVVGLRNKVQTSNTWSTYYQYKAYKKELWSYCIFKGEK